MEPPDDDIQKLIRLKRFEKPGEDYFENFLRDFQSRQRAELLHRSAHGLFCERLATYMSGFGRQPLIFGAGAAAALTVAFAFYSQSGTASEVTIDSSNLWDGGYTIPHPAVEPISDELDPNGVSIGGAVSATLDGE